MLDVCLYRFVALRGLWGFCVREWLGGFGACCVFALVFPLFALIFHSFALLLSSCFASCPFTFFALVVFVVSFSLSDYTDKKKGRKGFAPCVLLCPVVGCFIWLLLCTPRTRQVSDRLCRNKVL